MKKLLVVLALFTEVAPAAGLATLVYKTRREPWWATRASTSNRASSARRVLPRAAVRPGRSARDFSANSRPKTGPLVGSQAR